MAIRGEAKAARYLSAWGLSRLDVLIQGQTTPYTSMRRAEIIKGRGESRFYDLFKAAREGAQEQNPYVRPGDTIVLHKLDRKVTVSGQVRRPGTYQLLPGERLKELIEYYGDGFTETDDPRNIELTRLSDIGTDVAMKQYVDYEDEKARNGTEIKPFDAVMVSRKLKMLPIVFFEGAIGQSAEGVRLDAANRLSYQFEMG